MLLYCFRIVAQVLSDWNLTGISHAGTPEARDEACVAVADCIDELFKQERQVVNVNRQKKIKTVGLAGKHKHMNPNKEMAIAVDHALHSANLSFKYFEVQKPLGRLSQWEQRYFVDLPEHLRVEGCSHRRAFIWDGNTSTSSIELPRHLLDKKLHRPSLHKCLDEGAIGLPMTHWLDCFCNIRGSSMEDPWHRFFNDSKDRPLAKHIGLCMQLILGFV
jgi:hypothetical protein